MQPFTKDLTTAEALHGHLCQRVVVAVLMARMAFRLLGIENPCGSGRLIVCEETDECAAAALKAVAGREALGLLRSAAGGLATMTTTFFDVGTGRGVRIAARRPIPLCSVPGSQLSPWAGSLDEDLFTCKPLGVRGSVRRDILSDFRVISPTLA